MIAPIPDVAGTHLQLEKIRRTVFEFVSISCSGSGVTIATACWGIPCRPLGATDRHIGDTSQFPELAWIIHARINIESGAYRNCADRSFSARLLRVFPSDGSCLSSVEGKTSWRIQVPEGCYTSIFDHLRRRASSFQLTVSGWRRRVSISPVLGWRSNPSGTTMKHMVDVPDNYVKLRLTGPDGLIETPWAERIGDHFRLANLPWYAYGVSDDDLVDAVTTDVEVLFDYVRVVAPSGNRLIRVIFEDGHYQSMLDQLQAMGCHYEGFNKKYFAVSIPLHVPLNDVTQLLTRSELQWEMANPSYDDYPPI
jgi:hypothetical protein